MEKPILFPTEMVRAILKGRKTQMRQVIKLQPPEDFEGVICGPEFYEPTVVDKNGEAMPGEPVYGIYDVFGEWGIVCPYGAPGTILWVRETWGIPIAMAGRVIYKADYPDGNAPLADGEKWRPASHMPRKAARLFLIMKNVRVERLQDITEEDAKAEGATPKIWYQPYGTKTEGEQRYIGDFVHHKPNYRTGFADIWDKINGPRGYSWDKNPWVWVIEFEIAHPKETTQA